MSNLIQNYKEYTISIHPQPKRGDYEEVFFRVEKNNETAFILWVRISGTESREMKSKDEIFQLLIQKGLAHAQNLIDSNTYTKGQEFKFFENSKK